LLNHFFLNKNLQIGDKWVILYVIIYRYFSGACSCSPGYTGTNCELKCPPGFYGYKCQSECKYQNGTKCDIFNGTMSYIGI